MWRLPVSATATSCASSPVWRASARALGSAVRRPPPRPACPSPEQAARASQSSRGLTTRGRVPATSAFSPGTYVAASVAYGDFGPAHRDSQRLRDSTIASCASRAAFAGAATASSAADAPRAAVASAAWTPFRRTSEHVMTPWGARRSSRPFPGHSYRFHGSHFHAPPSFPAAPDDSLSPEAREGLVSAKRWVEGGVAADVGLAALKGFFGVMGNSAALTADAVHSLTDLVSGLVARWSVMKSRQPADASHPFGFGRYESVGAVVVSGFLVVAGFEVSLASLKLMLPLLDLPFDISLFSSGHNHSHALEPSIWAAGAAAVSIAAKGVLAWGTERAGKKANSLATVANAKHHQLDCVSSSVALVGILLSQTGYPLFDPLAGLLVGVWIARAGLQIGKQSFFDLADASRVSSPTLSTIHNAVEACDGVASCVSLRARQMGPWLAVDVVVAVGPDEPVREAHKTTERVQAALKALPVRIIESVVRVVPEGTKM